MINKLIVLCGKSGSGKDALLKALVTDFKGELVPVVSDTTRPMRKGEVNGVDYHFLPVYQFEDGLLHKQYIETRAYTTIQDDKPAIWKYGIHERAIDLNSHPHIVIVDLEGLQSLSDKFGNRVTAIFIDVEDSIREERASQRGGFEQAEWDRRLKDDDIKFKVSEVYDNVDYIVSNDGEFSEAHTRLLSIVKAELKR